MVKWINFKPKSLQCIYNNEYMFNFQVHVVHVLARLLPVHLIFALPGVMQLSYITGIKNSLAMYI